MARIRQANVTMALATIALAAISLTPILNAERISANSQLARSDVLPDLAALKTWGLAGQDALDILIKRSQEAGQEALAAHLIMENASTPKMSAAILVPLLPVSPKTADATGFLVALDPYVIDEAVTACQTDMPTGGKGCVLVVADFLPDQAGDEATLFYLVGGDLRVATLSQTPDHPTADWRMLNGAFPSGAEAEAMIRNLQTSIPVLQPAPIWQLPLGSGKNMVFLNTPVY
jgi:hypothetical protein